MSLLYTIYQDKRSGGTKKYYGRAVQLNTVDTDALASKIEEICTLTKADILACISALVTQMKYELQDSNVVQLNGFGNFRLGISTKGAETADDFTADNIKGIHVNFLPTGTLDKNSGKIVRTFTYGTKVKKYGE